MTETAILALAIGFAFGSLATLLIYTLMDWISARQERARIASQAKRIRHVNRPTEVLSASLNTEDPDDWRE